MSTASPISHRVGIEPLSANELHVIPAAQLGKASWTSDFHVADLSRSGTLFTPEASGAIYQITAAPGRP